MKKLILILSFIFLSGLIMIVILSKTKNVTEKDAYYTIPKIQTYHFEEGKVMCFEVYGNTATSIIQYPEKNAYFLVNKKDRYPLANVIVEKEIDGIIEKEKIYKYTIQSNLFLLGESDLILEECILEIKSESFTLQIPIGYLAIYQDHYPALNFTDLYANYAYIQGELHMIGFTIQCDPSYQKLWSGGIGPAKIALNYIENDTLYDSERLESSLKHAVLIESPLSSEPYLMQARQNYYFFPLTYSELYLITSGCILLELDTKFYYIEDFPFLANEIHLQDYLYSKQEGTLIYA